MQTINRKTLIDKSPDNFITAVASLVDGKIEHISLNIIVEDTSQYPTIEMHQQLSSKSLADFKKSLSYLEDACKRARLVIDAVETELEPPPPVFRATIVGMEPEVPF